MNTNPELQRTPIGRGHIAGICASFGFDYGEVTEILIDSSEVVVETFDVKSRTGRTTRIPVER